VDHEGRRGKGNRPDWLVSEESHSRHTVDRDGDEGAYRSGDGGQTGMTDGECGSQEPNLNKGIGWLAPEGLAGWSSE